jgi:AraC family transcriptional regulator
MKLAPTEFFGKPVARRQLPHFFITDNLYSEGLKLQPHEHERTFLAVCIAGAYSESVASKSYERDASTVAFHPAGEWHSSKTGRAGARVISVVFSPLSQVESLLQACSPKSVDLRPVLPVLPRLKHELRRTDTAAALVLESCVLEIIAMMLRPAKRAEAGWFDAVLRQIEQRFSEPWTIASLAALADVHPVHFARQFRRRTGRTVGQYIRELRVRRACDELCATGLPLAEIALRAGFADQSHLCRWIKRTTGMSPLHLRRNSGV